MQRPSIFLLGLACLAACTQTPAIDPEGETIEGSGQGGNTESVDVMGSGETAAMATAEAPQAVESEAGGAWTTGVSDDGLFEATWRVVGGGPIPVNEHFVLELKLARIENGERIAWEQADPAVRANMPEHRHGMLTRPVPVEAGGGLYEVPAMLFHMEGYWVLRISVRTGDGVMDTGHATFDLNT